MPEIPDVVPGEIIEPDDWGNPIRDRTVQRYANEPARDAEHPTPADGDLAFIATPPEFGILQVYDSGQWREAILATGGRMRGDFTVGDATSITNRTLRVARNTSAGDSELRATVSNAGATPGYTVLRSEINGLAFADVVFGDKEVIARNVSGEMELISEAASGNVSMRMRRNDGSHEWRFAVTLAGNLLLQSSTDGSTWQTKETWNPV